MQEGKRGAGRGRPRGSGRGAGRGKRGRRVVSSDEENASPVEPSQDPEPAPVQPMEVVPTPTVPEVPVPAEVENIPAPIDIEADISQLEAPTFTTISRGPPEPMLHLKWNHKVLLIGEKVLNPMIHSCDTCLLPILHYGRMIPCKHIFCLACAKREPVKDCPRCKDKVVRVEQTGLGTVFMCTHGGSRYNNKGCRRTYLSQRDLQAHINHRHTPSTAATTATTAASNDQKSSSTSNNSSSGGRKSSSGGGGNSNQQQSSQSSVRANLMNMQQDNLMDDDRHNSTSYSSRHNSRYSSHYEERGGGSWSSNNYR